MRATGQVGLSLGGYGARHPGSSEQQKLEKPQRQRPPRLRAAARQGPGADSLLPRRPPHLSPAGFSAGSSS